ncbi:MAG: tRNA (cytidine(34)-2'-O)-methyltransferase [Peptostreptococcaceae bacterium]|nr:tRNA (cytidine(34)-2'-O)-methyltransferase [Peptostreptococcaceae bacterium]
MAINIVLVEPEIPQNTGNIIRTCACTGAVLHLIKPLGFSMDEKHLRRAGLDYIDLVDIRYYDSFEQFEEQNPGEYHLFSTKATSLYTDVKYTGDCYLVFGKETKGLSDKIRQKYQACLVKMPMKNSERIRSLNLSNTVCAAVFEVIRQVGLEGMDHDLLSF